MKRIKLYLGALIIGISFAGVVIFWELCVLVLNSFPILEVVVLLVSFGYLIVQVNHIGIGLLRETRR